MKKLAKCVQPDTDLRVGRYYRIIKVSKHGMVQVIDDSGECYLHPKKCFRGIYGGIK